MEHNPHHLHERATVTPASAGWAYLSFEMVALNAGETLALATEGNEYALVPLRGRAAVSTKKRCGSNRAPRGVSRNAARGVRAAARFP